MKNRIQALLALSTIVGASVCQVYAENGFAVHGSVSATASSSDEYNYLGNTKDTLDLNIVDVILNSTHRFDSGLRAAAQIYAYKLGDYKELTLDFANFDYAFNQTIGIRLGRNKLTHGLYNDAQDLDSIRTFASLPFSFYPRPLRSVEASFDGVALYGSHGLSSAGSLDYQFFGGAKERISGRDNPLLSGLGFGLPKFDRWNFKNGVYGFSVFWNLPVECLKMGYSYQLYPKTELLGVLGATSTLGGSDLALPTMVDAAMGKGAWDLSGKFAGTPATVTGMDIVFRTLSAEYSTGKWVFAAEYKLLDQLHGTTTIPALALLGAPTQSPYANHPEYYYGMVSYQATDKIGLGLYYAYNTDVRLGSAAERKSANDYSKDLCPALSYNVSKWCVVKLEYHFLKGHDELNLSADGRPHTDEDPAWHYLVLKTTVTF